MMILNVFTSLFTSKHSMPTRLWRGGGLVAAFLATILIGNNFVPKDRAVTWDMLGHDFLAFYYGGTCALTGHYEQLYDLPATRAFEFKTGSEAGLALGTSFGPWWNPPFAAWMFAPFAALPYMQALHAWWAVSAVCLAGALALLCSMLAGGWKTQLLVPFLLLMTMPCFQAFCHGQNTFVSLLLLTGTVWLWRKDYPFFAGIICGLLFYKPQLGAAIAAVLCFHQGRRAILGVCLTGAALAVVNILTMPGTLHEFVFHMPLNLYWIQNENPYRWERHVTLKAFWRLVFQGDAVGPTAPITKDFWYISDVALLACVGLVALKSLRDRSASQRDRLIAATIAAMPLLMPFYFDYDSLLLCVAVVVFAADRQRESFCVERPNWEDRAVVGVWAAIFLISNLYTCVLGMMGELTSKDSAIAPMLTLLKTRVDPVIPLMLAAAVLLVRRGIRNRSEPVIAQSLPSLPTALAA